MHIARSTSIFLAVIFLFACSKKDLKIGKPVLNADGSQSEWSPVFSKRGKFSALLPGKISVSTNVYPSPNGSLTLYMVTGEPADTIAHSVAYLDGPKIIFDPSNWPVVSESIRKSLLKDSKLVEERESTLAGRKATELIMEKFNGQARITLRLCETDSKIYVAMVVMPNKFFIQPKSPETPKKATALMNKFFDSIKFN